MNRPRNLTLDDEYNVILVPAEELQCDEPKSFDPFYLMMVGAGIVGAVLAWMGVRP